MVVADDRKTPGLVPRETLPDDWASRGHCPACGTAPLKVVHLSGSPDYLLCEKCELSFEVASSGGSIRPKNIPDQLGFVEDELRYRWVEPSCLRKYLENRHSIMQEKASATKPRALSNEDVWNRTLSLYQLGNKPKMIQFLLIQAGATQAQAEAAFARLQRWVEQDTKRQTKKLWRVSGVTVLLVLAIVLSGWAFTMGRINAQLQDGLSNPATQANQPNMPLQVLNNLPDGIKPEFLKSPSARVENSGPAATHCPSRAADAARLFGGDAKMWQRAGQPGAWQLINTGTPVTIRVPQGMFAGYINNQTFMFSSADGPATIYNVNFVVIACE